MTVERSCPEHSKKLSNIAKASKNYWKYPEEFMRIWDDDLTVSAEFISENNVFHLENNDGEIIGFYSFFKEGENVRLEHLFILPKFIGQKFGDLLMKDFLKKMESFDAKKLILDADPNAAGFYEKFGFRTAELKKSVIKNRELPVMVKKIN